MRLLAIDWSEVAATWGFSGFCQRSLLGRRSSDEVWGGRAMEESVWPSFCLPQLFASWRRPDFSLGGCQATGWSGHLFHQTTSSDSHNDFFFLLLLKQIKSCLVHSRRTKMAVQFPSFRGLHTCRSARQSERPVTHTWQVCSTIWQLKLVIQNRILCFIITFRYMSEECLPASGAYVGLAQPGEAGSWQRETKVAFWFPS